MSFCQAKPTNKNHCVKEYIYVCPRTPQDWEGGEGMTFICKIVASERFTHPKLSFFPPFFQTQIGYNGRSARVVSYVVCFSLTLPFFDDGIRL